MANYEQAKYCPNCKKNVPVDQDDRCNICGSKVKKGLWSVRFRIVDINGYKQKRLCGFETKAKAKQAQIDFLSSYTPPHESSIVKAIKYEDALKQYFKYCSPDDAESTLYDKENVFKLFITPFFTNKEINKITKIDLLNWKNHIWQLKNPRTHKPYSWAYLNKIKMFFNTFLNFCEEFYNIPNQLSSIKTPRDKSAKKEIEFWEMDTFNKFISVVDDITWNTLWHTFMYVGARINEIRALTDSDIKNNRITINKALNGKKVKSGRDTPKATKNYKSFSKQIPSILQDKIEEYKKWKKENNIPGNFLFGGETPIPEETIRRHLRDDIKKAEVSSITPHGFRHSYVSMLIHLGVSTKVIATLIGDTEEQVLKTYGHLYSDATDGAINLLNKALNQAKTS